MTFGHDISNEAFAGSGSIAVFGVGGAGIAPSSPPASGKMLAERFARDSPLEEGGFEPSVPAGDQRGLLGSRLQTEELRNYQEYFSRGQDKINKTIPGVGISGEGIVSEKIER
jgi:hypothetical protein